MKLSELKAKTYDEAVFLLNDFPTSKNEAEVEEFYNRNFLKDRLYQAQLYNAGHNGSIVGEFCATDLLNEILKAV